MFSRLEHIKLRGSNVLLLFGITCSDLIQPRNLIRIGTKLNFSWNMTAAARTFQFVEQITRSAQQPRKFHKNCDVMQFICSINCRISTQLILMIDCVVHATFHSLLLNDIIIFAKLCFHNRSKAVRQLSRRVLLDLFPGARQTDLRLKFPPFFHFLDPAISRSNYSTVSDE